MSEENLTPVPRQIIRATREITVNINGETYDALLIPRQSFVEVDFTQFPEDDPLRRLRNIGLMLEVDLLDDCLEETVEGHMRLTYRGAEKLLDSL